MTTVEPLRAALYVRISSDQRDGAGVERQEKECRELADRLGWPVADVFTDNDISAFSRKRRTDYERLVEAIKSGRVDAVVTWHSDRMHRNPGEQDAYIKLCKRCGVQNAAVQIGKIDLGTPSGELNIRMLGLFAHFESQHKAERIRAAHRQIAERGGWHGGIRPFGYESDGVTIRADEAAEVKRIAAAVIRGESLRSLARELNSRGITTVTGKRWASSHLRSMLVRPRLAGQRQYDGKIIGDAAWPAILDRETWKAVKAIVEDPKRCSGGSGQRGPIPTALGSGLFICGTCGEPRLRLGGSAARRRIYRCGNVDTDSGQGHVTRVADKLDAFVEGALLEAISRPGVIEALCNMIDDGNEDLSALRAEQDSIRKELLSLAASCDAGDIDVEQLAIASRRKRQRDKVITAILTAASTRSPLDVLLGVDNIERAWDEVLTLGQRRAILGEVLTVTVLPTTSGGRAPDGSYFDPNSVRVELTERARSALSN